MTTEQKTRVPRNAEAITKGALELPLQERVDLRNALSASISQELEQLKAQYEKAQSIVKEK